MYTDQKLIFKKALFYVSLFYFLGKTDITPEVDETNSEINSKTY